MKTEKELWWNRFEDVALAGLFARADGVPAQRVDGSGGKAAQLQRFVQRLCGAAVAREHQGNGLG